MQQEPPNSTTKMERNKQKKNIKTIRIIRVLQYSTSLET